MTNLLLLTQISLFCLGIFPKANGSRKSKHNQFAARKSKYRQYAARKSKYRQYVAHKSKYHKFAANLFTESGRTSPGLLVR